MPTLWAPTHFIRWKFWYCVTSTTHTHAHSCSAISHQTHRTTFSFCQNGTSDWIAADQIENQTNCPSATMSKMWCWTRFFKCFSMKWDQVEFSLASNRMRERKREEQWLIFERMIFCVSFVIGCASRATKIDKFFRNRHAPPTPNILINFRCFTHGILPTKLPSHGSRLAQLMEIPEQTMAAYKICNLFRVIRMNHNKTMAAERRVCIVYSDLFFLATNSAASCGMSMSRRNEEKPELQMHTKYDIGFARWQTIRNCTTAQCRCNTRYDVYRRLLVATHKHTPNIAWQKNQSTSGAIARPTFHCDLITHRQRTSDKSHRVCHNVACLRLDEWRNWAVFHARGARANIIVSMRRQIYVKIDVERALECQYFVCLFVNTIRCSISDENNCVGDKYKYKLEWPTREAASIRSDDDDEVHAAAEAIR